MPAFGDRFPTYGSGTCYQLSPNDNWLAGFWTGLLWLAYAGAGDDTLRTQAETLLASFEHRLDNGVHITHDLGFLFTLSARAQWHLTRDGAARDLALRAARELLARFRPRGRYIQAWGPVGDPTEGGRTIIDTMMNIPLLFWAADEIGLPRMHAAARDHAHTTARHLLRPDGGTYHTFYFDQRTGEPLGPSTHQGYADDSLWARGQAWAIYGFAVAAAWCPDDKFASIALAAADCFMAELPEDGLARWDFRLPASAPCYPDSSANAIASAGMLRLADQLAGAERDRVVAYAHRLLGVLLDECLETAPAAQGLIRHGTYHAIKQWGVDEYFICGDYFFLEALLWLDGKAPDFWAPER